MWTDFQFDSLILTNWSVQIKYRINCLDIINEDRDYEQEINMKNTYDTKFAKKSEKDSEKYDTSKWCLLLISRYVSHISFIRYLESEKIDRKFNAILSS